MVSLNTGMSPLQIFKYPVTYALIIVVGTFSGVLTWVTSRSDRSNAQCWEEVRRLQQEKDDLTTALLVKNGIINEIKKTNDSLSVKEVER